MANTSNSVYVGDHVPVPRPLTSSLGTEYLDIAMLKYGFKLIRNATTRGIILHPKSCSRYMLPLRSASSEGSLAP